jgi:hypothetical protein
VGHHEIAAPRFFFKKKSVEVLPIISEPVLLSSPYCNNDSIEIVINTNECLPHWMDNHQMLIFFIE